VCVIWLVAVLCCVNWIVHVNNVFCVVAIFSSLTGTSVANSIAADCCQQEFAVPSTSYSWCAEGIVSKTKCRTSATAVQCLAAYKHRSHVRKYYCKQFRLNRQRWKYIKDPPLSNFIRKFRNVTPVWILLNLMASDSFSVFLMLQHAFCLNLQRSCAIYDVCWIFVDGILLALICCCCNLVLLSQMALL